MNVENARNRLADLFRAETRVEFDEFHRDTRKIQLGRLIERVAVGADDDYPVGPVGQFVMEQSNPAFRVGRNVYDEIGMRIKMSP